VWKSVRSSVGWREGGGLSVAVGEGVMGGARSGGRVEGWCDGVEGGWRVEGRGRREGDNAYGCRADARSPLQHDLPFFAQTGKQSGLRGLY